jgi:protein-arginine kinase activator protein McsA
MAENLYPESAAKVGAVQCPACGTRYSHFARTGRLGCPECYTAFAVQMRQILRRIHGATRHKGKAPGQSDEDVEQRRALTHLREELTRAIEREEFETAARLRDEIHEMETAIQREEAGGAGAKRAPGAGSGKAGGQNGEKGEPA